MTMSTTSVPPFPIRIQAAVELADLQHDVHYKTVSPKEHTVQLFGGKQYLKTHGLVKWKKEDEFGHSNGHMKVIDDNSEVASINVDTDAMIDIGVFSKLPGRHVLIIVNDDDDVSVKGRFKWVEYIPNILMIKLNRSVVYQRANEIIKVEEQEQERIAQLNPSRPMIIIQNNDNVNDDDNEESLGEEDTSSDEEEEDSVHSGDDDILASDNSTLSSISSSLYHSDSESDNYGDDGYMVQPKKRARIVDVDDE
jgi:hypothetical protein